MSSQIQNKLLHYEVSPPPEAWDKIAASLNENIPGSFSEKLYQFETNPPKQVWEKIDQNLDSKKQEAKVVPFYVRYRRPLKYSSAIAIFIFAAVLVSLLISKKTESELPVDHTVNISTKKDSSILFESKEDQQKKSVSTKNNSPSVSKTSQVTVNPVDNDIVSGNLSDKYMIYYDADGNTIRLPKKIFNAFVCPLDRPDNADCKQRLKKLKEKFASSAVTADFNGILEILRSLQENQ